MRKIWVIVAAFSWVLLPTDARADTVYLTNGESIWGRETLEEADVIVIVRPGGDIRIPKSQVSRVERIRTTLPPFYSPPAETARTEEPSARTLVPGGASGRPGAPGAPAAPLGAPGGELSPPPSPGGPLAPPPPSERATTQLPPPPPPPMPGR